MGVMEGRDRHHIQGKYQDLYRPLITANWQVWPLAQVWQYTPCITFTKLMCPLLADQLPLHAPAVSRTVPVHLRRLLDAVPLAPERKVRTGCLISIWRLSTDSLVQGG